MPLISGTDVTLPYYVDPDTAQPAYQVFPQSAVTPFRYQIPSGIVEYMVSIHVSLLRPAAEGAVPTEVVVVHYDDPDGFVYAWIPGVLSVGSNTESEYSFGVNGGNATSNPGGGIPNNTQAVVATLPMIPLLPNWTVNVGTMGFAGFDPADEMTVTMFSTQFETGSANDNAGLTPTPVFI